MISDHGAARRRSSDPNSCFEVRTAGGRHYLMQAKSSGGVPSRIVALLSRARPISFTVCTRAHPPNECTLSLTLVLAHAHDGFNQMQTCGSVPCANTQPRRHLAKLWTGPKVLYRFASEHTMTPKVAPTLHAHACLYTSQFLTSPSAHSFYHTPSLPYPFQSYF